MRQRFGLSRVSKGSRKLMGIREQIGREIISRLLHLVTSSVCIIL